MSSESSSEVSGPPSMLDLAFIVDNTSSMGTSIAEVQRTLADVLRQLTAAEKTDTRFALVQYRDYGDDFVVRSHPFTASRRTAQGYVDLMEARGGGDGPEAVAAGLQAALALDWRKTATKVCILVADAPPHGLEPSGDNHPDGGEHGCPFALAQQMAAREIVCMTVGAPGIDCYRFARHFLISVAHTTNGQSVTLESASLLPSVILAGTAEEVALDRLAEEMQGEAQLRAGRPLSELSEEERERVCAEVAAAYATKGKRVATLHTDGCEAATPQSRKLGAVSSLREWKGSRAYKAAGPKRYPRMTAPSAAPSGMLSRTLSAIYSTFSAAPVAAAPVAAAPVAAAPPTFSSSDPDVHMLERETSSSRMAPRSAKATYAERRDMAVSAKQVKRVMNRKGWH